MQLYSPILLGHSMGGMTATVVASLNPKLLHGLILADPSFLNIKAQLKVCNSDVCEQHQRALQTSFKELMADLKKRHPNRSSEIIELIARAKHQMSMAAYDVLTLPNPDYTQLMKKIDIPVLLIFGDKGVITPDIAEDMQRLNTKIQVAIIPDAGHGLHYDQPVCFASVVKSFIHSIKTNSKAQPPHN